MSLSFSFLIYSPLAILGAVIVTAIVVEPSLIATVSGSATDTTRGSRCHTLALRDTANATLIGRIAHLANTLEHFVDLRFQHPEILDGFELGQMLAQSLVDRQISSVPVVLEESPVLFDAVQLSWN